MPETAETKKLKKKILLGITKATWGGAQRYLFDLATNLPREKFDIIVMAGEPGLLKTRLEERGIRVLVIPDLARDVRFWKEWRAFRWIFKTIREERPDILHLNSPKISGLGALAGRLLGVPRIVTTVHGWTFFEDRGAPQKAAIAFLSWVIAALAHRVILITRRDYKTSLKFPFIARRKFDLIHNGVPPLHDNIARETARGILRSHLGQSRGSLLAHDSVWIGAIGELTANKDFPMLIRAMRALPPEVSLIIIGEGEERLQLASLIKNVKAESQIFLAGFIPDAAALLPAFDILALTSRKEGLPYVLLEAGLAHLAVAATDVGGVPDIVSDKKTGLLAPAGKHKIFADALQTLIRDPKTRHLLAANLHATVKRDFSLAVMLEKTREAYL